VRAQLPTLRQYIAQDTQQNAALLLNALCTVLPGEKLLTVAGHIFQTLYEGDIMAEDAILQWYDAPVASTAAAADDVKSVKAKLTEFIDWLKTADEAD